MSKSEKEMLNNINEPVYDAIGTNYVINRQADSRIIDMLYSLLDLPRGSIIADIGAGTGNYSRALADKGYTVKAIEPSSVMREQSQEGNNIEWIDGFAENIPLGDATVHGVIVVLALHHFTSIKAAADEMYRICPRGPVVVFTQDPRESDEFWFPDYFPEIWQHAFEVFPPIDIVIETISLGKDWSVEKINFPLPFDLMDKFMIIGWRNPELYLDPTFRQSTSGFALAEDEVVTRGLERLRNDIKSGVWDRNYGYLKEQSYFNAGFQFLLFKSN